MTKNPGNNEMQRLPLIEKDLHTQFKAECAMSDKSMQDAAKEAIENWLEKRRQEREEKDS